MRGTPLGPGCDHRQAPGAEPDWCERWYVDWSAPATAEGGIVELSLWPNLGRSVLFVGVVGLGGTPAVLIDDSLEVPRAPHFELRGPGVWIDVTPLVPLVHLTVQLEAFGVAVDGSGAVDPTTRGERVPLGLDLEWETEEGVLSSSGLAMGLPCRVIGEVAVGTERREVTGTGIRRHSWGVRPDPPLRAHTGVVLARLPEVHVDGVSPLVAAGPTLVALSRGGRGSAAGRIAWSPAAAD